MDPDHEWKQVETLKMVDIAKRDIALRVKADYDSIQEKNIHKWEENDRNLNSFFPKITSLLSSCQCALQEQTKLKKELNDLKSENARLRDSSSKKQERIDRVIRLKQLEIQNKDLADQILHADEEINLIEINVEKYKKKYNEVQVALKKKKSLILQLKASIPQQAFEKS